MVFGVFGGGIATTHGGWDTGLQALLICMSVDYISGLLVAGVFKNSLKSKNGALESRTGWKGLCCKIMTLLAVLAAHCIDLAIGTNYIKDAAVIGYVANEVISIIENAGLMGIPLPGILKKQLIY